MTDPVYLTTFFLDFRRSRQQCVLDFVPEGVLATLLVTFWTRDEQTTTHKTFHVSSVIVLLTVGAFDEFRCEWRTQEGGEAGYRAATPFPQFDLYI